MSMVVARGGVGSSSASEAFRFPPVTWALVELELLVTLACNDDDDEEEDKEASCETVAFVDVDAAFDPPPAPSAAAVSCGIGGGALSATLAQTVRKHSINGMNRMVRAERVAGSSSNPSFASAPRPEEAAWGSSGRTGWEGSEALPLALALPPGGPCP